ncbi:DUF3443 domain-containing protein [Paraburkholderia terrae]|uniref:DUF3443 domain-containing protein n=1 Tax=Paraburkholderia terrae TaxID=311230 RepID=A0ABN6JLB3_9BURK|nr:DUF3443 domain-containing protein [Paraburkholderia terrae]BCZ80834.1 hypothetical protein PTKU64_45090 [Paraburkholderia terrae]BDC40698.1 hypothetical protein PTKU15_39950 [Paraburkholderia terrae]
MRALKWILAVSGMCVALAGCGGGGGSSNTSTSSASGTSTPAAAVSTAFADPTATPVSSGSANTVPIVVSSFSNVRNFPMVSVKVCQPNSGGTGVTCSTIDNVLVDTESFGLRLFASAIPTSTLNLLTQQTQSGQTVAECASFGSGNTWGTVRAADVSLSSEVAVNVPIQVIADPSLVATIPTGVNGCLAGTNMTTPTALGANGILGIGTSPNDCGLNCENNLVAGAYYVCSSSNCTPAKVTVANQVTNPVTKFTTDNNGVIVEMAQVPDTGAATATGTLVFGIDTQSNNALSGTSATILPTTLAGDMDAVFEGRTYSKTAFFDSGSSGLYFQSTVLSKASNGFYTPAAPTGMTAVFTAANSATATVKFNVSNGVTLINSGNYAFNNLGVALFNSIDIGMPFFYGRHMYYGISGQPASSAGAGPYVAYVSS